jgi:alpha-galactosidase
MVSLHRRLLRLLTATALTLTACVTASAGSTADAAPGSPALTPPLGWNSWNSFGCGITEAQVREAADAMVSSGMRDAGYRYVVVDDCWFDPQRDAAGNLRANPTKFPSGMKALGDYIHSKGLKFGIYQAPNEKTCAQGVGTYPGSTGSKGHEAQDATTFASWGVDYLKYDWCSGSGTLSEQIAQFTIMRDALRATGRPIVYSINPNSFHSPTGDKYNWREVADLWRTTEDLLDIWQNNNTNSYPMGVGNVLDVTAPLAAQSGPGHWNDPDMLVVGRPGLSLTESRSHFALWALMSAPLTPESVGPFRAPGGGPCRTTGDIHVHASRPAVGDIARRVPALHRPSLDHTGPGGRRRPGLPDDALHRGGVERSADLLLVQHGRPELD